MKNYNRINAFDIAKGIGIILVYIGHVPPHSFVRHVIYTFHMPLFFILSGLLFDENKYRFKDFMIKRLKGLLVPSFFFSCFAYLCSLFSKDLVIPGVLVDLPSALWFLPVLFFAEIVVYTIYSLVKEPLFRLLVSVCFLFAALLLNKYNIYMPWSLSSVPIAASFFCLGSCMRSLYITERIKSKPQFCILGFSIIIAFAYICPISSGIHSNYLAYGIVSFLVSVIGFLSVIALSFILEEKVWNPLYNFLIYCGRNSLAIYGLHFTLLSVTGPYRYLFNIQSVRYIIWNFVVAILIYVFTELINRKFPFIIGRF